LIVAEDEHLSLQNVLPWPNRQGGNEMSADQRTMMSIALTAVIALFTAFMIGMVLA
jgi:hypothetical protein